ncbi:(R)-1-hydroxy-2-aminoethylphosphonate ammonia-lyase [Azospirillum sp. ST 5-10]|uniref:(R)-1-hydroxy-2-aminoethylphosphonate ammonia-lyase n=1 Tax=unclassified Azospirillum TaxID=2630922 RepID=UPI003F4A3B0C
MSVRQERQEGDTNRSGRRAAWAAEHVGPRAAGLVARDAAAFLSQSLSTPCLSAVRKAEGIWIEDADGRRFMDFHGNNVHHLGYGHPRLRRALAGQLDDLTFSPRRFTNAVAVELAETLTALAPGGLDRVLFATGGSDALEIALKLARVATGRHKTVSFWDSFHGAGFGAASVGGEAHFRSHGLGPLLAGAEHVAPFACYRCPYGHPGPAACGLACAGMVRYVLEREGDVAAVVAEPVRSVPYLPPPGFWPAVRAACDAVGALLIFDEIPNGLGKTGRLFTAEHVGVTPDLLVLGKALGGGMLPIAAVLAPARLDVAGHLSLGHYTHEKNPLTARAALTTLEIIRDEGLVENAARVGAHALERLHDLRDRHALIGDVRGLGLLIGVELVRDRASRAPADDAAERVLYAALARGLSFKTTMGSVLTLTPPLVTTIAEMDRAIDILDAALAEVGCR